MPGLALQEPSRRGRGSAAARTPEPGSVRGQPCSLERSAGAAQARSSGLPALPFKSPPGAGNGGGWGAQLHLTGDAGAPGPRTPAAYANPAPLTRAAPAWEGAAGPLRLRRPAPRPAPRRVSARPPPPPPPPHLGSSLVGAQAGPEAPGGPPARAVHGVLG